MMIITKNQVWFKNDKYSRLCFKHAFNSFIEQGMEIEAFIEKIIENDEGETYLPYCQKCKEEREYLTNSKLKE